MQHLLLVGGLGESPYLRKTLKDVFGTKGVNVVTVDESTKKAAAEGSFRPKPGTG
jgi:tRNA A37 threonylcarbamoyltransferase TsaD